MPWPRGCWRAARIGVRSGGWPSGLVRCVRQPIGSALAVTPPEECDAAMKRDGIDPKPPAGIGERAWWLDQIVSAAPLDTWSALDGSPADLVAAQGHRRLGADAAPGLGPGGGPVGRRRPGRWRCCAAASVAGRTSTCSTPPSPPTCIALLPPETALTCGPRHAAASRTDADADLSRLLDGLPAAVAAERCRRRCSTHLRDQTLAAKRLLRITPRCANCRDRHRRRSPPLDAAADVIALADKLRAAHDDPAVTSVLDRRRRNRHLSDTRCSMEFAVTTTLPRPPPPVLRPHAEDQFADELAALAAADDRPRPPGWRLSPSGRRDLPAR